jgi:hypothetical protein
MPRASSPLELTYASFEQFWKALVSKRKARKLDVDVASAWQQLSKAGRDAGFLRRRAESKAAKAQRTGAAEAREPAASTRKKARIAEPAADTAGNKTPTGASRRGGTKIATGIERGAEKKTATSKKRGTRKKATRR